MSVGVSHHTAPVAVRERFALDEDGVRAELARLRSSGLAREAMLVATCNRSELYVVPETDAVDRLRAHVFRPRAGLDEPSERYLVWREGEEAVRHLFRVASALDSLVVGEPQILGQVKDAVRVAAVEGALGPVLHRLAQRTLWVAKQVRTHTELGRHTVGVGNAGVALAGRIFSSLQGRRALLVGTGEMGRQVARAMVGAGIGELLVTNRTFATAVEVAAEHGGVAVPFERLDAWLGQVDVVIVATGASRPVIDASQVAAAVRERRGRPLFLVDLAVPRNVDPRVDAIDSAYLFNLDDLTAVVQGGLAARRAAVDVAERTCAEQADRFARRLADLGVHDRIGQLVRHVEGLREVEIERSARLLSTLTDEQRAGVDTLLRAFAKKVLHAPIAKVREASREGDESTIDAILGAWDVDETGGAGEG